MWRIGHGIRGTPIYIQGLAWETTSYPQLRGFFEHMFNTYTPVDTYFHSLLQPNCPFATANSTIYLYVYMCIYIRTSCFHVILATANCIFYIYTCMCIYVYHAFHNIQRYTRENDDQRTMISVMYVTSLRRNAKTYNQKTLQASETSTTVLSDNNRQST